MGHSEDLPDLGAVLTLDVVGPLDRDMLGIENLGFEAHDEPLKPDLPDASFLRLHLHRSCNRRYLKSYHIAVRIGCTSGL